MSCMIVNLSSQIYAFHCYAKPFERVEPKIPSLQFISLPLSYVRQRTGLYAFTSHSVDSQNNRRALPTLVLGEGRNAPLEPLCQRALFSGIIAERRRENRCGNARNHLETAIRSHQRALHGGGERTLEGRYNTAHAGACELS